MCRRCAPTWSTCRSGCRRDRRDRVRAAVLAAAVRSLTHCQRLATEMGDEYVSTEHMLVGLAAEGGPVAELLRRHGATPDARCVMRSRRLRGSARVTSPDPEGSYKALEKYRRRPHRAGPRGPTPTR